MKAWAVPIVTGHKYKIRWGWGIDFTSVTLSKSEFWTQNDRPITFVYNHLVHRERMDVIAGGKITRLDSLPTNEADLQTGMFWHNGTKGIRELQFALSGGNASSLRIRGIYCEATCPKNPPVEVKPLEVTFRYWSDALNWPNETVPTIG